MIKKTNKKINLTLEQRIAKLEKALLEEMSDDIQGEVTLGRLIDDVPFVENLKTFNLNSVTPKMIVDVIKADMRQSPEDLISSDEFHDIKQEAVNWARRERENALHYHEIDRDEIFNSTYTSKSHDLLGYTLDVKGVDGLKGLIIPDVTVVVESDIGEEDKRTKSFYYKITDIYFKKAGKTEWEASSRAFRAIKDTELGMKLTELGEGVASLL